MMIAERQHQRIKGALKLRGSSLSAVARSLDVAPTTVTIKGIRRSRRIEAAIASALGMTPDALWPDRYNDSKSVEVR